MLDFVVLPHGVDEARVLLQVDEATPVLVKPLDEIDDLECVLIHLVIRQGIHHIV